GVKDTINTKLLALAARRDRPHLFDLAAPDDMDVIVEVDGGIAVRRDELDAVANPDLARGLAQIETAMLVARPSVGDPWQVQRHGRERPVGREGLVAGVHNREARRTGDDRGDDRQCLAEVAVLGSVGTAYPPVLH